jgi:hypothetical protein
MSNFLYQCYKAIVNYSYRLILVLEWLHEYSNTVPPKKIGKKLNLNELILRFLLFIIRLLVSYEWKLHQLNDTFEHNLWSSEVVSDGKRKNVQVGWGRPPKLNANDRRRVAQSAKMVLHKNRSVTKKFGGVEEKNWGDIGWALTRFYGDINNTPTSIILQLCIEAEESISNTKNVYKTLLSTQLIAQTCYGRSRL